MPAPSTLEMAKMVMSDAHDVERALPKEDAGDEGPRAVRKKMPKGGQSCSTVQPIRGGKRY